MKKLLGALLLVVLGVGCQNEDLKSPNELNLRAPSGVLIATSVDDLKQIAITTIGKRIKSSEIEILSIEYLQIHTGFAAMIDYSINGQKSNFAYFDYDNVEYSASSLESKSARVELIQEVTVKCNGTCGCKVEGTIKPDGTITFGCSCTDCTATIVYPEWFFTNKWTTKKAVFKDSLFSFKNNPEFQRHADSFDNLALMTSKTP